MKKCDHKCGTRRLRDDTDTYDDYECIMCGKWFGAPLSSVRDLSSSDQIYQIKSQSLMELDPNLALALVAIAMPASIIGVLKSFASGR